jgi:Methyltransferase FkbM domain
MLELVKKAIKRVVFNFIKPPIHYERNCYSQAGEDVIVNFLFEGKKIRTPSYLELGVFLPDWHSNTYLFYQKGSRGVLVEADETLIPNIAIVRPLDKLLNIGVGIKDDEFANFYIFDDPALNTFSKDEADSREKYGTHKIMKVSVLPLRSINAIISENFSSYPDYLSIDLEGLDFSILKTLDFEKYPIPVICVETCRYSENYIKTKNKEIINFMSLNDYFVYGDTYINTIFVNNKWFYSNEV